MTSLAPVSGLIGGALIGLAAVVLMLSLGRIAGVCGIAASALVPDDASDRWWRVAFIAGLPLGAFLVSAAGLKDWTSLAFASDLPAMAFGGFIVGFGATIGSGCTSGHGVCGLARLSPRSIVATATFLATAVATVFAARHLGI